MIRPIVELPIEVTITKAMVAAVERIGKMTEHYSKYTPGGWEAVSLRSFGGRVSEISKPACMNSAWLKKHPGALKWDCKDTDLYTELEIFRPLVETIPGEKERIRFMKLRAGSEILQHTDRVDKDFINERLRRIHIPITTNKQVIFYTWIGQRECTDHLEVGKVYFLNAGLKHAVNNNGKTDRVHLVMDVVANPKLNQIMSPQLELEAGAE
jgi:hypothetical protein